MVKQFISTVLAVGLFAATPIALADDGSGLLTTDFEQLSQLKQTNKVAVDTAIKDIGSAQKISGVMFKKTLNVTVGQDKQMKLKAKTLGVSGIKLTWKAVKYSEGYKIYRSEKKSGKYKKIATIKNPKKCSYVDDSGMKSNKKYYYKISPNNPDALVMKKIVSAEVAAITQSELNVLAVEKHNDIVEENTIDKVPSNIASAVNFSGYKAAYTLEATAYSGGGHCANGKECRVGRVAVDPNYIPLGTWLYVEGYGLCQACDTGGAIKGYSIDLYYDTEWECYEFGRRAVKVYIL